MEHIGHWFRGFFSCVGVAAALLTIASIGTGKAQDALLKTDFGWNITQTPPEAGPCVAQLPGEVDTVVMLNRSGNIILHASNPEWSIPPRQRGITLSIDGAPAENVQVPGVNDFVMVAIADDATERRLLRATSLGWHILTKDFRVIVHDVDRAVAAVRACEQQRTTR